MPSNVVQWEGHGCWCQTMSHGTPLTPSFLTYTEKFLSASQDCDKT